MAARLAAALHSLTAWLDHVGLHGRDLNDLIEHLWQWLTITPDTFTQWHDGAPVLVETALGDEMPSYLVQQCLDRAAIPVADLRHILESTTEIVYCNLFGAVDDQATMNYLRQVEHIMRKYSLPIPPASLFSNSLFSEGHGWGRPTVTQTDAWRAIQWPPSAFGY
ncbi:MAG: hypothetical protein ACRDP6_12980 [Actinoallomurus sp.]